MSTPHSWITFLDQSKRCFTPGSNFALFFNVGMHSLRLFFYLDMEIVNTRFSGGARVTCSRCLWLGKV